MFIYAGYRLGERWDQVQQYLQPISYLVGAALSAGLLFLIVRQTRRRTA